MKGRSLSICQGTPEMRGRRRRFSNSFAAEAYAPLREDVLQEEDDDEMLGGVTTDDAAGSYIYCGVATGVDHRDRWIAGHREQLWQRSSSRVVLHADFSELEEYWDDDNMSFCQSVCSNATTVVAGSGDRSAPAPVPPPLQQDATPSPPPPPPPLTWIVETPSPTSSPREKAKGKIQRFFPKLKRRSPFTFADATSKTSSPRSSPLDDTVSLNADEEMDCESVHSELSSASSPQSELDKEKAEEKMIRRKEARKKLIKAYYLSLQKKQRVAQQPQKMQFIPGPTAVEV